MIVKGGCSKSEELFFFAFGISLKETNENKKLKYVEKAYFDFCRTIKYLKDTDSKKKEDYKNQSYVLIVNLIDEYPRIDNIDCLSFDDWHHEAINKIIKISKKSKRLFKNSNPITVGQAQKWLNMSLKYMSLMDVLNDRIKLENIHVPIDNYVIDAAKKVGKISQMFGVEGLGIEPTFKTRWSQISEYENEYMAYQNKLREGLLIRNCSPIEWETQAWMAEASEDDRLSKSSN